MISMAIIFQENLLIYIFVNIYRFILTAEAGVPLTVNKLCS